MGHLSTELHCSVGGFCLKRKLKLFLSILDPVREKELSEKVQN